MELRVLRYFLAVAREGNVTRAATVLHVTQPTLSRQLSELERELGCELFSRNSRGIELTDSGRLLRQRAEEMVALADRTTRELSSSSEEIAGEVHLGLAETRAVEVVADAVRALRERHPGVRVRLHSGNATNVIDLIEGGILDFGLLVGHGCPDTCNMLFVPHLDRWGLVVPSDDPLARRESIGSSELRGLPLLLSAQRNHGGANGSSGYLPAAGDLDVVGTYNLAYNAVLMVERGCGYAVSLDGLYGGDGTRTTFVPIEDAVPLRSIVVWKRNALLTHQAAAFLEELRSRCAMDDASLLDADDYQVP